VMVWVSKLTEVACVWAQLKQVKVSSINAVRQFFIDLSSWLIR
jgi:hypothetical protein